MNVKVFKDIEYDYTDQCNLLHLFFWIIINCSIIIELTWVEFGSWKIKRLKSDCWHSCSEQSQGSKQVENGQWKGLQVSANSHFFYFWKPRKIPGLDFWKSRDREYEVIPLRPGYMCPVLWCYLLGALYSLCSPFNSTLGWSFLHHLLMRCGDLLPPLLHHHH